MPTKRDVRFPVLAVALSLTVSQVMAQAPASTTEEAESPNTTPSGEVVTLPTFSINSEKDSSFVGTTSLSSTRIAVDLAEVPQSVKVLNNSFLKAINPTMMSDVLNYVGGGQNGALNWTPGRMNIRGFTGDADYTDGFAPPQGAALDSMIFDRFEIIKGPSAIFLAADGSPGGIVNKVTKSPLATQQTTISVQTGLFEGNHLGFDTTGPITKDGKLLYRFVGGETYYDGYYKNVYMHRFTGMAALSYQFAPDTKLEIKAELVQTNWPSYNGITIDPRTLTMFNLPYDTSIDEDSPYNWRHDDVKRIWATFNTRFTDWLALSVRGMSATDRADRFESIPAPWNEGTRTWAQATPFTFNGITYPGVTPTTYANGAIPRSTTADDAHGSYVDLQVDLNFNYATKWFNEGFLLGVEDRGTPGRTITYSGNSSSSPWFPYAPGTPPSTVTSKIPSAYTATQGLFQRIYFLETLKVWDDRIIFNFGANRAKTYGSNFNYLTGNPTSFIPFTFYKNLVQWGGVIKIVPGLSAFAGYNQNFASNGVGTLDGKPNSVLPPKLGEQHEVGIKFDFMKHAITGNVAYFDINQQNNTVPSFPLDPANPNILIPGVISRGFDMDFNWQINRHMYLMGTFANYAAKAVLGPAVNGTFAQPGLGGKVAYGSLPVDNTAEHTASLYGLYEITSGTFRNVSVGLGANFQSKRAVTDGPNQVFFGYIPERTIVNGVINWKQSKRFTYTLNIDNILDKKYIYSVRSENIFVPGTPINAKISAAYTF